MNARRVYSAATLMIAVLGAIAFCAGLSYAEGPQQVSVTLNAGETYTINDLSEESTPAVHVLDNPNALVVRSDAPGKLVLVGAGAGKWAINVKNSSGNAVTYNVTINSVAGATPITPGAAPVAMSGSGPSSAPASATGESASSPSGGGAAGASATSAATAPTTTASSGGATSGSATSVVLPPAPSATMPPPAAPVTTADYPPAAPTTPSSGPEMVASSSGPAMASPPPPAPTEITAEGGVVSQAMASQVPSQSFNANPLNPSLQATGASNGRLHYLPDDVIDMAAGTSEIYDFPRRLRRLSIADTTVADLQVINPYQMNVIAHKPGFTTLAVWDAQGSYEERQIKVDAGGKQQVMLNVIVAELNRNRIEQQGINLTAALPDYNVSLVDVLPNGPATPYNGSTNLTSSEVFGAGTVNQVVVSSSAQGTLPSPGQLIPLLLSSNTTYALAAGNSHVQTQSFFEFLEQHNLAKVLAEPHLLANSGEKAEFLSGGEIPIVVAQALNTSIVFKQFGVSVIFVPTVVGRDDVELEVKPEVSEPDYAHAVQLFGFTVPAFVTRRAQTFVRLRNRQTLIIAGLLLDNKTSIVNKTPYLGDIPYLGRFFNNTYWSDQKSDLVMTVTPEIIEPIPAGSTVALPIERGPLTAEEIRTERLAQPDVSRPRF